MTLKNLILASFVLILSACGGGGSNSSGTPKRDLKAEAKAAPALTTEQKQQISTWIKTDKAIRPNIDLYFDAYEKPELRQRDLSALNDEGKEWLKRVKADCDIAPAQQTSTGAYEVGKILTEEKTKSVTGAKCPVNYSEKEKTVTQATKQDIKERTISSVATHTRDISDKVLDPELRKKLAFLDSTTHTEGQTIVDNYKSNENGEFVSGTISSTSTSTLETTAADGNKITGSVESEFTLTPKDKNLQILVNMKFPKNISLTLGIFKANDNIEIILNGQNYTLEQLQKEFGGAFNPETELN